MTNERKTFFPPEDIIDEFKNFVKIYDESNFDVVTIVSEGEPVLYFPINVIIDGIKK
jgi:wyosine [tRNA(Phe)-imidazoG37] synthetase (radical SAM superfamily)